MTTPSPSSEEMQKDLEYIERHGCTVTEEKMKEVIAYIRSLEKDHNAMESALLNLGAAWVVEGKHPLYHRGWQQTIAREWPVLHDAILRCYSLLISIRKR